MRDDLTEDDLETLADLDDDGLLALFGEDELDTVDEDDPPPPRGLSFDHARPATRDPGLFNPFRPVLDGPSVDDYEPATHTGGIAR